MYIFLCFILFFIIYPKDLKSCVPVNVKINSFNIIVLEDNYTSLFSYILFWSNWLQSQPFCALYQLLCYSKDFLFLEIKALLSGYAITWTSLLLIVQFGLTDIFLSIFMTSKVILKRTEDIGLLCLSTVDIKICCDSKFWMVIIFFFDTWLKLSAYYCTLAPSYI